MDLGLSEFRFPFRMKPPRDAAPAAEQQTRKNILGIGEEAAELMRTVSDALRGFPEARQSVIAALKAREEDDS